MYITNFQDNVPKSIIDTDLEVGKLYIRTSDKSPVTLINFGSEKRILELSLESGGNTYRLGGGYRYLLIANNIVITGQN